MQFSISKVSNIKWIQMDQINVKSTHSQAHTIFLLEHFINESTPYYTITLQNMLEIFDPLYINLKKLKSKIKMFALILHRALCLFCYIFFFAALIVYVTCNLYLVLNIYVFANFVVNVFRFSLNFFFFLVCERSIGR